MAGKMAKSPSCMDSGVVLRIAFVYLCICVFGHGLESGDTHTAGVLGHF